MANETAEQLMARINAKYGIAAPPSAPQNTEQPQSKAEPAPQENKRSSPSGIVGILGGRKDQIDKQERKAMGYANGGIVKGKGTSTSDDVPVKISGKNFNLSNTEAVLPGKTRQALGEMLGAKPGNVEEANALVESFIETTNGKPPVPVNSGTSLAAGGILDLTYDDVMNGGVPNNAVRKPSAAGSAEKLKAAQVAAPNVVQSPVAPAAAAATTPAIATPQEAKPPATVDDGAGGVYTPGGGAIAPSKDGILSGITGFFKDSARAARGEKPYDQLRAERAAGQSPAVNQAASQDSGSAMNNGQALRVDPFGATPERFKTPGADQAGFMTGKGQYDANLNQTGIAAPDSSGGGFTQGNTSYNVNPSSQEGIAKITATGKAPIYTNTTPESATSGVVGAGVDDSASALRDQKSNDPYWSPAAQLDRMQKRRLMSDLTDPTITDPEVRQRAAVALGIANNQSDAQLKQAQAKGILATTENSAVLADLQKKAIAGDAQALATLNAIQGKSKPASDRFITVQGGEEIGPDGITKINKPSGVFDAQTQRFVSMNGDQQGGPSQADLEFTAKKYGMTVEQVKAKLAQQQGAK